MNISVDGGGLCAKSDYQYGNFTFSKNLLKALQHYDNENKYTIYTFCDVFSNAKTQNISFVNLQPKKFWMKLRVSLEEFLEQKDIFLAFNQSLPLHTNAKTVVFSHGLSFIFYPDLYSNHTYLVKQVDEYIRRADIIIVSSQRVFNEMKNIYPQAVNRIIKLPFGLPIEFEVYEKKQRKDFFIFCGMNHKIKNIEVLIKVFNIFIADKKFAHFKLYLAGPFQDYASDKVIVVSHQSPEQLKLFYQTAKAYITTSLYESFNFPVLEALSQGCPVIAMKSAIIPEMNEFVNLATSEDELLHKMELVSKDKLKKIDLDEVKKKFSWEKYITQLKNIYRKLE